MSKIIFLLAFFFCLDLARADVSYSFRVLGKSAGSSEDFRAIPGTQITIVNGGYSKSRVADGEGYVDFGSVPTGTYSLHFYYRGYFYTEVTSFPITTDQTANFKFTIQNGVPPSPPPLPTPEPIPPPVLMGHDPNPVLTGDPFVINFDGANFRRGAKLEYSADLGVSIYSTGLDFVSPNRVRVLAPGDVPPGSYYVRVRNPDGQVTAPIPVVVKHNGRIEPQQLSSILSYILDN